MANESDTGSSEGVDDWYRDADDSITIEWLIENQYNRKFWKNVRRSGTNFSEFRNKSNNMKPDYMPQKNLLGTNKKRIHEIYTKHILSSQEITKAIYSAECTLIAKLNIPNDIIVSIVSYVGNGIIPICYRLSYLPFFRSIREHKLYRKTLHKWWEEVITEHDHRGVFYPTSLKNAALEFQRFFTEKLSENGVNESNMKRVKYHRYMVPIIMMEIEPSIIEQKCCKDINIKCNEKNKGIAVRLPTASGSSACVGGIELFQRLYLETAINPEYVDTFNVDLISVDGNHGDNWCFDGSGNVLMADMTYKKISALQIGDNVRSFPGNATAEVKCVIVSNINKEIEMVELNNNCWITFEHPVLIQNDGHNAWCNVLDEDISNNLHSEVIDKYNLRWALPKDILPVQYRYQDKIYNFVLDCNHTLNVNGNWCCTLGHDYKGYCIEHEFWGNSTVIHKFLRRNSATYPRVVFG